MYKKDLALNKLQWLICHKTKSNQSLMTWKPKRLFRITVFDKPESLYVSFKLWIANESIQQGWLKGLQWKCIENDNFQILYTINMIMISWH